MSPSGEIAFPMGGNFYPVPELVKRAARNVGRHCTGGRQSLHPAGTNESELHRQVTHARGNAEDRRRDQAVGRAAEEASLTSTRRMRGWPSSTSRPKTPLSGTTSSAHSA